MTRQAESSAPDSSESERLNFVERIVAEDLREGRVDRVHTRFPPEPNGYPHIGHAKAICVDFGIAERFGGVCNLRFDDTNPGKESVEYVEAIKADVRWLGFDWGDRLFFASDWFEDLYKFGEELVEKGLAYVCDLSAEETREYRGTVTEAGKNSPYRDRPMEESLDLLRRMRAGEFEDGARTLKAKIDMASPNMNMRDPVLYRIMRATHHRTGDDWCIYPMYDFAHGQCDALEHITHSLCSLEFENHRPLYDWFTENLSVPSVPHQYEFARLKLTYTVVSKRKLVELVDSGLVSGWDDPRMPTLRALRRRGYTPESVREFCKRIGVAKFNSTVDYAQLDGCLRDDLNKRAERRMAVLRPLKVTITNWPEGHVQEIEAVNNPEDESAGTRVLRMSSELLIEQDDFREEAPRKFFRLKPGGRVRLRYGYVITCDDVIKDDSGAVTELRCTYHPETLGGAPLAEGGKVKGIVHWVNAQESVGATVNLYDHLFRTTDPEDVPEGGHWHDNLNPDSLEVLTTCQLEPSLADAEPGERFQFERLGYFCVDCVDSAPGDLVFNRTATLRDTWAKLEARS
ncbi:MAG: glutamine--tRNA ligase/YqeY domain fusion protein [Planctomycetota bacterium]|nr:glutamine--tRNA ligase/YqeY domain fusion protein [Planctomycetota bacterium]